MHHPIESLELFLPAQLLSMIPPNVFHLFPLHVRICTCSPSHARML